MTEAGVLYGGYALFSEVLRGPSKLVPEIGSIVPLGRESFPNDLRHFVPSYDRAVSLGRNTFFAPRFVLS
jgi:hypothetical protein